MTDSRILLVTGMPNKVLSNAEDLYKIFGEYGAVRQMRVSASPITKGCLIVVYEQCDSAEQAVLSLDQKSFGNDKTLRVTVYDKDRDRKALERRKRAREKRAEYNRHIAEGVAGQPDTS